MSDREHELSAEHQALLNQMKEYYEKSLKKTRVMIIELERERKKKQNLQDHRTAAT